MVYCWQGAIWIFIDNERAIIRHSKMQRQAEGWQRMISAAVSHIYHWLNQPCTSQEAQVMEGFHCREHTGNASYCTANSQVYSCRNAFSKKKLNIKKERINRPDDVWMKGLICCERKHIRNLNQKSQSNHYRQTECSLLPNASVCVCFYSNEG